MVTEQEGGGWSSCHCPVSELQRLVVEEGPRRVWLEGRSQLELGWRGIDQRDGGREQLARGLTSEGGIAEWPVE